MSQPQLEELTKAIQALTEKVATLEAQVATIRSRQRVPEDHLVAIGAAVAAYCGHKAKVRAVRFGSQARWGATAFSRVHDRSVPHVR